MDLFECPLCHAFTPMIIGLLFPKFSKVSIAPWENEIVFILFSLYLVCSNCFDQVGMVHGSHDGKDFGFPAEHCFCFGARLFTLLDGDCRLITGYLTVING